MLVFNEKTQKYEDSNAVNFNREQYKDPTAYKQGQDRAVLQDATDADNLNLKRAKTTLADDKAFIAGWEAENLKLVGERERLLEYDPDDTTRLMAIDKAVNVNEMCIKDLSRKRADQLFEIDNLSEAAGLSQGSLDNFNQKLSTSLTEKDLAYIAGTHLYDMPMGTKVQLAAKTEGGITALGKMCKQ